MKVVENTSDRLHLRSAPWLMGVLLSGAIISVIWFGFDAWNKGDGSGAFWGLVALPLFLGLFLVLFVRRDDAVFDARRKEVLLHHRTFLRVRQERLPLAELERAMVQSLNGSDGGPTHRVALVAGSQRYPLTTVYTGGRGAERATAIINDWLAAYIDSSRAGA